MLYNQEKLPRYVETAGKITILTALAGVAVFIFAFLFDVGTQEFNRVIAVTSGTATTSLRVLNTPPFYVVEPYEVVESSTSSPTNSGDAIVWAAIGEDPNEADYFLLVCSGNATPTPGSLAPPSCHPTTIQWGVSASTTGAGTTTAFVSTTTAEGGQFAEVNQWFAWVCDADEFNPRSMLPALRHFI
jgi:hypothetical protein